jgi:carboxymethylenebutenolidase
MGWIELKAADGHGLQAWCARPPGAVRGGIVVLQEIFGVNAHIRSVCDRWAAEGWLAIAPALYDRVARGTETGYDAQGIATGRAAKEKLGDATALTDVQAAVDFAHREAPRVAVMGFCWGGTLAWLAASRLRGVDAAVAYYGTNIAGYLGETPKVPVLLHFGEQDTHIPPQHVQQIVRSFPAIPVHLYPAGHGFSCDARPSFDRESAALAAERTRAFLAASLKTPEAP